MKEKFTNTINIIKSNKKSKYMFIATIMLIFISVIGFSLSLFTNNNSKPIANIKVNDLSFNITTNTGESDDRILRLQAGKTETFSVNLTSLNSITVKYELKYTVCSDSNCTTSSSTLPNNVMVAVLPMKSPYTNGLILPGENNIIEIELVTRNLSDKDVYIKLDLNAGYEWNDLALDNQFELLTSDKNEPNVNMNIIAYVDGVESNVYPNSCNYLATLYNADTDEVLSSDSQATCDRNTSIWKITISGFIKNVKIKFKYQSGSPAITFTGGNENIRIENGDSVYDWKIYILGNGTLTFTDETPDIDVFLVGGGAAGNYGYFGGSGGGGGYTKTVTEIPIKSGTGYEIVIGSGGLGSSSKAGGTEKAGGSTSAFGYTINGGDATPSNALYGGKGGSGGGSGEYSCDKSNDCGDRGPGGTDGGNGGGSKPGTGQGTTTREFGETNGNLYASGGGGCNSSHKPQDKSKNTGDGGDGGCINDKSSDGASGVVVIRRHVYA